MRLPDSGSLRLAGLILLIGMLGAEPYRPYPVIFVHGINSNATTWGFTFTDQEIEDGKDIATLDYPGRANQHTARTFKGLMEPYKYPDPSNPFNTLWFIAALNFDDFGGSIDPGDYESDNRIKYYYARIVQGDTILDSVDVTLRNRGSGAELRHFIKKVLWTYYGDAWNLNPNAKVVLVAHSMGGVIVEEALHQDIKQEALRETQNYPPGRSRIVGIVPPGRLCGFGPSRVPGEGWIPDLLASVRTGPFSQHQYGCMRDVSLRLLDDHRGWGHAGALVAFGDGIQTCSLANLD